MATLAAEKGQAVLSFHQLLERDASALSADEAAYMLYIVERARDDFAMFCYAVSPGFQFPPHIQILCATLGEIEHTPDARVLVTAPPRHGKPCYSGSMVLTGGGTYKQLGDIHVDDFVVTHTGARHKVLAVHEQGDLPVLKITTDSGRSTIAAYDHPFLTPTGWIQAGDLRVGQTLANVVVQCSIVSERSNEEFRLAGYFVGDGSCGVLTHDSFGSTITCFDPEETADIFHCVATLGFECSYNSKGRIAVRKGVRPWLQSIGLARTNSHTKRVPDFVFGGSPEQIGHFLGAYFSCDGLINKRSGVRSDMALEFYSVSSELLRDIQKLLLRLGIQSRLRTKVSRGGTNFNKEKRTDYVSYRLAVTSVDDAAKFKARVPIYGCKKLKLDEWDVQRSEYDRGLLPDKIVLIEADGVKPCRCLTVETDHSFTVDDLAVHNSMTCSTLYPAWYLGRNPDKKMITASYIGGLTGQFASQVRNTMEGKAYSLIFPNIKIAGKARGNWGVQGHKGGMMATGVTSSMTGFGADCLHNATLIDTPSGKITIANLAQSCENGIESMVYSYDHDLGEVVVKRVIATAKRETNELYTITTAAGKEVRVTGNHRIFVEGKGYRRVSELVVGDCVLSVWQSQEDQEQDLQGVLRHSTEQCTGEYDHALSIVSQQTPYSDTISSIECISGESEPVYDIQVEGTSNFFAGDVLVHNCLMIDDPIRDAMYADSPAWREHLWDWFASTAYTRLHPGAPIFCIATRWHHDDLTGRLLARAKKDPEADQWTEIYFPAIDDKGKALWPERYDVSKLNKIKATVGSRVWNALYQGRPTPDEGNLFKRWMFSKVLKELPTDRTYKFCRFWDKAGTADGGDYTVGVLMAVDEENRVYICHVVRGQWSALEREQIIRSTSEMDLAKYGTKGKYQIGIEQEPGSGGLESAQATVRRLIGFKVKAEPPKGSLSIRSEMYAASFEAGNGYMIAGDWNETFVEEHCQFPLGEHDDQIAAACGAFYNLTGLRSFKYSLI